MITSLRLIENNLKAFHSAKLASVAVDTESELQASGVGSEATYVTSTAIANAKRTVDGLIQQKGIQYSANQALAMAYSGSDPLTLTDGQRSEIVVREMGWALSAYPGLARSQQDSFGDSYSAGYKSRILAEAIAILNRKSAALTARLAQVQAAEAEALRIATEQSAQRAAEAKRLADEEAAQRAPRLNAWPMRRLPNVR